MLRVRWFEFRFNARLRALDGYNDEDIIEQVTLEFHKEITNLADILTDDSMKMNVGFYHIALEYLERLKEIYEQRSDFDQLTELTEH